MKKLNLLFFVIILTLIAVMLFVFLSRYGSSAQPTILNKVTPRPHLESIQPTTEYSISYDDNDLLWVLPANTERPVLKYGYQVLLDEQRAMEQRLKANIYLFCGICSLFLVLIFYTVKPQRVKNSKTTALSFNSKKEN